MRVDQTYGRGRQPDGWDLWQFCSYLATGLSVVSLFAGGKQGQELGQAGTVLGLGSSALHAVTAPPRCERCRCRMSRVPPGSGLSWYCQLCRIGKA